MRWKVCLAMMVTPLLSGCFGIPAPVMHGIGLARTAVKLAVGPERYRQIDPVARVKHEARQSLRQSFREGARGMPAQPPPVGPN